MKRMRYLIALLFVVAVPAFATPIELDIKFRVDRILVNQPPLEAPHPFNIGDGFSARLTVDDSILATDGPVNAGKVTNFYAQIGLSTWDQNNPSDFSGFRGPCYGPIVCTPAQDAIWGLGSEFLGFEVLNHQVVGLWGGVFGSSDFPWIDFLGGQFSSVPHYWIDDLGFRRGQDVAVQGALRVPEPNTLALVCASLLCFLAGLFPVRA